MVTDSPDPRSGFNPADPELRFFRRPQRRNPLRDTPRSDFRSRDQIVSPPAESPRAGFKPSMGRVGSVVAVTSGGMTFDLLFDAASMGAADNFRAGIEQAASMLVGDDLRPNHRHVDIDYSESVAALLLGPVRRRDELFDGQGRPDQCGHVRRSDFHILPTRVGSGPNAVAVWDGQLAPSDGLLPTTPASMATRPLRPISIPACWSVSRFMN